MAYKYTIYSSGKIEAKVSDEASLGEKLFNECRIKHLDKTQLQPSHTFTRFFVFEETDRTNVCGILQECIGELGKKRNCETWVLGVKVSWNDKEHRFEEELICNGQGLESHTQDEDKLIVCELVKVSSYDMINVYMLSKWGTILEQLGLKGIENKQNPNNVICKQTDINRDDLIRWVMQGQYNIIGEEVIGKKIDATITQTLVKHRFTLFVVDKKAKRNRRNGYTLGYVSQYIVVEKDDSDFIGKHKIPVTYRVPKRNNK